MERTSYQFIILAAGGIIIRKSEAGPEVLIIHRNRYDDFSLPKGKMQINETIEETALREVKEETGYKAIITGVADVQTRWLDNKMKITVFFTMKLAGDEQDTINANKDDEVKETLWLHADDLLSRLTYPEQADIILKILKSGV